MEIRILLLCFLVMCVIAKVHSVIVEIEHGKIRGKIERSILNNKIYHAFKGIPYAAPPVGELRFKAPQPLQKWSNILDATEYGQVCSEPEDRPLFISFANLNNTKIDGGEDCLFLNVFTPELPKQNTSINLKPVLFYMHGGAFWTGSGNDVFLGPDFIIEEDVVLVTVNSRVGVLGFLSLENVEVPGNFGLKDLVAALKWVQSNIAQLGGDPQSITISGQSTGAVSAHYLMISPQATNLFHKAILQSGNVVTPRALSSHSMKERAFKLGKIFGLETTDPDKLIKFLRTISAHNLTSAIPQVLTASTDFCEARELPFPPTIEPEEVGHEAIITSDPVELLRSGHFAKIPIMMGNANSEYMFFLQQTSLDSENLKPVIENLTLDMPLRGVKVSRNSDLYRSILQTIREIYHLQEFFSDSALNYIELQSDMTYNVGNELAARIHTEVSDEPLYSYRFSYEGAFNLAKNVKNITVPGASHADEICYQFACKDYKEAYKLLTPDSRNYKMIKVWSKLISNFVKTGNPTSEKLEMFDNITWLPRTKGEPNILDINEELKLWNRPETTKINEWLDIMENIN